MKNFDRKDVGSMFLALGAIGAIPLCVWVTRPRPLSAPSPGELTELARSSSQEEVLTQMSKRYEGMSLNFEGPDTTSDPAVRWQEIQDSMEHAGATANEVTSVIQTAQAPLQQAWPILAERGYLRGQPVWLVIGSTPRDTGFIGWPCSPSAEAIRQEKIKKYCAKIQVVIVSAEAPYQIVNR